MIILEDILNLHTRSIDDFGGSDGIRDQGLLESAIARPFQTFDGEDLYPSPFEKAAALGESLIINHPFVDGNKRTGMLGMVSLIMEYGFEVISSEDDLYNLTIDISTGTTKFEEIVEWLKTNTKSP
jgi:death-on-curing protein